MKKKIENNFNPVDYDYMDSMPLEGWIWEFIRRSEKYRGCISEYEFLQNGIDKNRKSKRTGKLLKNMVGTEGIEPSTSTVSR